MKDPEKILNETDLLTGLNNHRAMEQRVDEISQGGGSFGVMYAEINDLQDYRDYFGLVAGDIQVKKTAVLIEEAFEGKGEFYRVGDGTFVVISAWGREEFEKHLKKIDEIKDQYQNSKGVTFSAGSCFAVSGKEIRKALSDAYDRMKSDKERYISTHPKGVSRFEQIVKNDH